MMEIAVARFHYDSMECDELTIVPDQLCRVIKKDDSGWWQVRCEGNTGLIPGNYTELLVRSLMAMSSCIIVLIKKIYRKFKQYSKKYLRL